MLLGAAEWNHDIAARWVELDNPMLSEINQTQEDEHNMFFFLSYLGTLKQSA